MSNAETTPYNRKTAHRQRQRAVGHALLHGFLPGDLIKEADRLKVKMGARSRMAVIEHVLRLYIEQEKQGP